MLDTCRVDALRAVAPEYEFISDVDSIISVGSTSSEWIANTFRERYTPDINETAYLSANAFSERVIEERQFPIESPFVDWRTVTADEFLLLDQAWRHGPDPEYKHMSAEDLTDRAIVAAREYDPDRLIVHYSQPHKPYVANAKAEDRELRFFEREPFRALREGDTDYQTVWESYLDNLRMGLDSVERLLANIDADRVVLSADHGESFGEYGGVIYGHPRAVPHPHVKRVPWAVTTAEDIGTADPDIDISGRATMQRDAKEHLQGLGYL
ncbi:hypothetical protein VB773_02060 [Haloarculaceae archaeon H-GB2-1]|nr:sulfatase-like hydrolase/transferase [Haloarculaceae archaeon H-GB1-1]MEA5388443.1 hypothetical protein [Haloarculaceae archaeon H-GB11]MEA5406481.1 hypothetical protein [Haloarculaceae archaeon H-GB2-1]